MPSKKSERKAASKGTTVSQHRDESKQRSDARHEANEAKIARVFNDQETTQQLMDAVNNSESFNDLWNNPMIRAAREQMTPEQIAQYERIGREMYGTLDFENINESKASEDDESLRYIEAALRSGLKPCDLEEVEKDFMKSVYGDNWYDRYGGYGQPLPGAASIDDIKRTQDNFLRLFGGERMDMIKELGGKR
jgi:hypothetical protein